MISGVRASSIRIEFDFVDDGVGVPALHHVLDPVLHVVAQIIEAELVVGGVSDIAVVLIFALGIVEAVHDDADRKSEKFVDLPHPFGVALGEIIVDGDDMDAAAGERVEIDGERGDQRLAFAGLHLGNPALVQHHAADELDVEVALTKRALAGLAHGGKSRHQNVIRRCPLRHLLAKLIRARAQRLVGELFQLLFQRIDGVNPRPIRPDAALVGGTEKLTGDSADHRDFILPTRGCATRLYSSRSAPVQPAENAGLFGLLQGGFAGRYWDAWLPVET